MRGCRRAIRTLLPKFCVLEKLVVCDNMTKVLRWPDTPWVPVRLGVKIQMISLRVFTEATTIVFLGEFQLQDRRHPIGPNMRCLIRMAKLRKIVTPMPAPQYNRPASRTGSTVPTRPLAAGVDMPNNAADKSA